MGRYLLRRFAYLVFVFIVISIIMFSIFKAMPGDPALLMVDGNKASLGPREFEERYQAARKKLALDQHETVQYAKWMGRMVTGDLGYSITYQTSVANAIAAPMQNTIRLNLISMAFVLGITIPLGIASAVRRKTLFDTTVQVGTVVGYSLPVFIFAILFILIFAIQLRWLPISGVGTPGFKGTYWEGVLDMLRYMLLPTITIVFSSLASIVKYVRAAMIEALSMDYIRTARAKGLREKVVVYSHAFRNSMIPVVTIMTGWFISVFSGSVVIERIFLYPGMGKVLIDSIMQQDFFVSLALSMFYVLLSLLGNLIMDIGYCLVDPRVKLT